MPLPPAPTKRASLLASSKFSTTASAEKHEKATEKDHRVDNFSGKSGSSRRDISLDSYQKSSNKNSVVATTDSLPSYQKVASTTPVQVATAATKAKRTKPNGPAKLFVLDTNVLMHDPMCLFRFEEHDIYLPMIVLEELDGHKKGMTEVNRNARQTSRSLDALAGAKDADMALGLRLDSTGHREAKGRLFFQTQILDYSLPASLPQGKADNQILGVVAALRKVNTGKDVVLVSKDINMRVKARALGLSTDDYQNDKTLEDGDLLYSGALALPADFWTKQAKNIESWQEGHATFLSPVRPTSAGNAGEPICLFRGGRRAEFVRPRGRST